MGFLDIFFKKNFPALNAPQEQNEAQNKVKLKIFSQKNEKRIEYGIEMENTENKLIRVGTISTYEDKNEEKEDLTLKQMIREIEEILNSLTKAKETEQLEEIKQKAKQKLNKISTKSLKFTVTEEIINYVEEYDTIDYSYLESLPMKMDIRKLSSNEIIQIGEQLTGRLDTLNSIKTPEDAYRNKSSLISFMKHKEKLPNNPLVNANLKSDFELDNDTIVEIAKNMEQEVLSEDGALYSTYLKIEEKRILEQIMQNITEYAANVDIQSARELNKYAQHITKQIKEIKGGFSPEVLKIMIDSMKHLDVKKYIEDYKALDLILADKLEREENLNIRDKEEIERYLRVKAKNLGQLYYRSQDSEDESSLRYFIENTKLKDIDDTESKEFLYIISQIEKTHINSKFEELIKEYERTPKGKKNNNKFREELAVTPAFIENGPKYVPNNNKQNEYDRTDI